MEKLFQTQISRAEYFLDVHLKTCLDGTTYKSWLWHGNDLYKWSLGLAQVIFLQVISGSCSLGHTLYAQKPVVNLYELYEQRNNQFHFCPTWFNTVQHTDCFALYVKPPFRVIHVAWLLSPLTSRLSKGLLFSFHAWTEPSRVLALYKGKSQGRCRQFKLIWDL